jgi:uncharacterized delta-60 repeat protein
MSVLRFLILLVFVCRGALWAQFGALDPAYQLASPPDGIVRALVVQPDGKLIIAGDFQNVGDTARGRIARFTTTGALDTTFATGAGANGTIRQIARQSDGKIIIAGDFTSYDGVARGRIARLNTNGTLDATFVNGAGANGPIHAMVVEFSTVWIGGEFTTFNGITRNRVARLGNGFLDSFDPNVDGPVYAMAVDLDVIIGGDFQTVGGQARPRLARLRFGSILDANFPANTPNGAVRALHYRSVLDPDGLMLAVGGEFTALGFTPRNGIAFLNSEGGFHPRTSPSDLQANGAVFSIVAEPPGSFLSFPFIVGGEFTEFGGLPKSAIARVVSNTGTSDPYGVPMTDPVFNSAGGPNGRVLAMHRALGRIYLAGEFSTVDGVARPYVARVYDIWGPDLPQTPPSIVAKAVSEQHIYVSWAAAGNASGYALERSSDNEANWVRIFPGDLRGRTYLDEGLAPNSTHAYRVLAYNPNGYSDPTAVVSATTRAVPWTGPGSIDPSAQGSSGAIHSITSESVNAVEIQPDGKILLGGSFDSVHGIPANSVARLNSDWTVDSSFNVGTGSSRVVQSIARTRDGKLIVAGYFTEFQETPRNSVARLSSTGVLDAAFDPGTGPKGNATVDGCVVDQQGRPLVFGSFSSFGGTPAKGLVRLDAQGKVDSFRSTHVRWAEFVSPVGASDYLVGGSLLLKPDVYWGTYGRISARGVLDASFGPPSGVADRAVVLPNGGAILAGSFLKLPNGASRTVVRIKPDGTVDPNFDCMEASNRSIEAMAVQPDGKVIIGGSVASFAGNDTFTVFRLNADGTFDTSFDVGGGANLSVDSIDVEDDGRIVVGGSFTKFNGQTVSGIVRLRGDPPPSVVPAVPGTISVTSHSATAISVSWAPVPGATRYFVEVSDDGVGNWTLLDAPAWQTTTILDYALTPGKQRFYRIAARNAAGMSGFSDVATATTRSYNVFESWNIGHGFPAETPEDQDADHDGLPQLVEFALGRNPNVGDAVGAITTRISVGMLEMSFTKSRTDVGYAVEASEELGGPWSTEGVEMSGDPETTARVPATAETQYLRLRVSFP